MFSKEYILKEAQNNNMRSFKAHSNDGRSVVVKDQPTTRAMRFADLEEFLKNAKGAYQIEMWDCYDLSVKKASNGRVTPPKGNCFFKGEVFLKEDQANNGMGALDHFAGVPSLQTIQTYEQQLRDKNDELNTVKTELMLLKNKVEQIEEKHKKELEQATAQDQKIMGYLGQLSGILGGSPSQMGNVEAVHEKKQTMNKEKLVNAVNDLCEIDSNFDEHLSKLANIAKTKPEIYKIAIKQLSNL